MAAESVSNRYYLLIVTHGPTLQHYKLKWIGGDCAGASTLQIGRESCYLYSIATDGPHRLWVLALMNIEHQTQYASNPTALLTLLIKRQGSRHHARYLPRHTAPLAVG